MHSVRLNLLPRELRPGPQSVHAQHTRSLRFAPDAAASANESSPMGWFVMRPLTPYTKPQYQTPKRRGGQLIAFMFCGVWVDHT